MLRILFGQIFPFIRKAVKQNSDTIYKKKTIANLLQKPLSISARQDANT